MTVAPGLLDRRVVFYEPHDGGADGFVRPVYVRTGEWWGRIDATADAEQVPLAPQAHTEHRTTAAVTVADYVPVPQTGLVKELSGDTLYFIRGVVPMRALRCQKLTVEAITATEYGEYTLFEDTEVLDGIHLVTNPAVQ